jgi:hypothetical protein
MFKEEYVTTYNHVSIGSSGCLSNINQAVTAAHFISILNVYFPGEYVN